VLGVVGWRAGLARLGAGSCRLVLGGVGWLTGLGWRGWEGAEAGEAVGWCTAELARGLGRLGAAVVGWSRAGLASWLI
jgi:hypothetical protein